MIALVLADGFGNGHVPLTETVPAPLVPVAGRAPLDAALDRLADAGIAEVRVAAHRHQAKLAAHLAARTAAPRTTLLPLAEPAGPAGAIAQALGSAPLLVVAADALRLDGASPGLARLAAAWDGERMDALLLVAATVTAVGVPDSGEIFVDPAGRARPRVGGEVAPYAFAGAQIVHPRLFADAPAGAAIAALWTRAAEAERLWAVVGDGVLCRLASDAARAEAEEIFEALGVWRRPKPAGAAAG